MVAGFERGDGTGEDVDGFAEGESAGGDGAGTFAGERGVVEAAFAGDNQIGGGEFPFEVEPCGDEIEPWEEFRIGGRHEAEGNAAGGTGAGEIHERAGAAGMRAEEVGEARAFVIEAGEVGGAQAFLGAESGGGSAGTEEGIVDVAGDADRWERAVRKGVGGDGAGRDGGGAWGLGPGEGKAAGEVGDAGPVRGDGRGDGRIVGGVKGEAEGGEGAETEIVGRAAADTEENGGDAGAGGGETDEFTGADGGGVPQVALVGREEGEAGGGGHLHDGDGRGNVP